MQLKPWLQKPLDNLLQLTDTAHMPHAIILSGAKDIGKLELIQHFISQITTIDVSQDNLKTDDSEFLLRYSNYSPLIYIQREKNTKTKQKYQDIRVEQVRNFCDFIAKTNDKLQIGIIKYADEMNVNSANALLKTLEEPRANTLIILLVHNIKNIIPTLLSRCQKIHINTPNYKDSISWININVSKKIDEELLKSMLIADNFVPQIVVNKITDGSYKIADKFRQQLITMAINPNNINDIDNTSNQEKIVLDCLQNLLILSIYFKINKVKITDKLHTHIINKVDIEMFFKLLADVNYAKSLVYTTINIKLLLDNILIIWSHIMNLKKYPKLLKT